MARYVANGKKQTAGELPDNARDRIDSPTAFNRVKTPNYILVTKNVTADLGLHFNPTTFSASAVIEQPGQTTIFSGSVSASNSYTQFNSLSAGTYNLHPIAVSGSDADVAKIKFVYKSGLSTGGF